jgi:hypothetical protein
MKLNLIGEPRGPVQGLACDFTKAEAAKGCSFHYLSKQSFEYS